MNKTMHYSWFDFYKDRVNNSYQEYFEIKYSLFLSKIFGYCYLNNKSSILEIGCGISSTTKFLLGKGIDKQKLNISDSSDEMLRLSLMNLDSEISFHNCYNINVLDFNNTDIEDISLIHSHGLLEHFVDKDIVKIIDNISSNKIENKELTSIHYVPGCGYKETSFGDERLLSKENWKRILGSCNNISYIIEDITVSGDKESDLCIKIKH